MSSTGEAVTAELPSAGAGASAGQLAASREQCPACGAASTVDQRYCVECGQRLARARPPLMEGALSERTPQTAPSAPDSATARRPRFRLSPNSTLIAGVGTLLLAMGVGVLIGRSGQSTTPARGGEQILTVPSAAATTGTSATPASAGATTAAKSSGAAGKAASTKPTSTASKPPNPSVTIGAKGTGKGYQHGHFTGHFFGAENEEEANEEAGSTSSGSGKTGSKTGSGATKTSGKGKSK